ncbi:LysM-like peptidoglycan-binding domain-containing protein [Vibrio sp.]|uniref:LysM-like peptidoglycan-binding domain-containing protein n=1 Tax=Vibrio sp. TaxID=678 RepID=UPI003D1233FA
MNRRKRKPPQINFSDRLRSYWTQLDWQTRRQQVTELWFRLPKLHRRLLPALLVLVVGATLFPVPESQPEQAVQTEPKRVQLDLHAVNLSEQGGSGVGKQNAVSWQEYQVKSGDTLAQVFRNVGLPMTDLYALVKVEGNDKPLSYIKQGQLVRYKLAKDGQLDILQLEKDSGSVMFFRLSDGGFGRSK